MIWYGDFMQIKIKDVNINYVQYGRKKADTIVYLHGWGQNIQMMKPIADPFSDDFNILIVDIPGYGLSEEPTYPWTCYDYVECFKEMFEQLNIDNPILIGHSFGGKISLLYASKYQVKKLVLFGSPFKQEVKKISLKVKMLKGLKKVPVLNKLEGFAKRHMGSDDYRNASETMRKILVETVNLDISEEVKKIKCPTLIIWGTNDEAVPLARAYELEKLIADAGVVVYENGTHYAYLEQLQRTISILKNFL